MGAYGQPLHRIFLARMPEYPDRRPRRMRLDGRIHVPPHHAGEPGRLRAFKHDRLEQHQLIIDERHAPRPEQFRPADRAEGRIFLIGPVQQPPRVVHGERIRRVRLGKRPVLRPRSRKQPNGAVVGVRGGTLHE